MGFLPHLPGPAAHRGQIPGLQCLRLLLGVGEVPRLTTHPPGQMETEEVSSALLSLSLSLPACWPAGVGEVKNAGSSNSADEAAEHVCILGQAVLQLGLFQAWGPQ